MMKWIFVLLFFVPLTGQDLPESPLRNRVKRPDNKVVERAIPKELRAQSREEEPSDPDPKRRARRRNSGDQETRDLGNSQFPTRGNQDRVSEEAEKAAIWVSETQVYPDGYREYFQVGYYFGLNEALEDSNLGRWDFEQGTFDGQNDPSARNGGRALGKSLAYELAEEDAKKIVEEQFSNLTWSPRMEIPRSRGHFPGLNSTQASNNWNIDPFFRRYPANRYGQFPKEVGAWRPDIYRLRQCNQYTDFYDRPWTNLQRYFDVLIRDRRNGAYYRNLNQAQKANFKHVFLEILDERVWDYERDWEKRAYPSGLRSGWQYGCLIQYELQYQRGYEQGKIKAEELGARSAFDRFFPQALETSYREEFNWWQSNPVLRTYRLEVHEGNEDGILEPGEEVELIAHVDNFGGARGRSTIHLNWNTVGSLPSQTIVVGARRSASLSLGKVRLPQRVELPFRLEIESAIDGHRTPFFFDMEQAIRMDLDKIDVDPRNPKKVTISLILSNKSSRNKTVRWMIGEGDGNVEIQPKSEMLISSELEVQDPFLLLSGRFQTEMSADWKTGYISKHEIVPETASNLESETLLSLTNALLSKRLNTNPDWFLDCWHKRLLADWVRADDSRGNPYKDDYKRGSERTEMGRLLNLVKRHRNPDGHWVNLLQDHIEEWAEDFPGAHPFLRKYLKRLARKL